MEIVTDSVSDQNASYRGREPLRGRGLKIEEVRAVLVTHTKTALTPSILKLQQSVLPFWNPQDQGYPLFHLEV